MSTDEPWGDRRQVALLQELIEEIRQIRAEIAALRPTRKISVSDLYSEAK